jgi:lysophospholipase L1-like esterase
VPRKHEVDMMKMASRRDQLKSRSRRKVTFLPNKGEVNVITNDEKAQNQEGSQLNKELLDLRDDMLEFNYLLKSTVRSSVKEIIKYEIDVISAKITSLNDDSSINNEDNMCWREVRRKNRGSTNMKHTFMIPTIVNSFQLLNLEENNYETSEGRTEFHRIPAKARGKTVKSNKKTNKVILLGDSHARNIAKELQHNLGQQFKVIGLVKPGSRLKDITDTMKSDRKELTNKDVCVVWGGANDIAKNGINYGLRRLGDFVTKHSHTNLIAISAPHRYDLQHNSCINDEVKVFNRKLKKYGNAFNYMHILNVENNRDPYTHHGLHLNSKGKECMASKIASKIAEILAVNKPKPIQIQWKDKLAKFNIVFTVHLVQIKIEIKTNLMHTHY